MEFEPIANCAECDDLIYVGDTVYEVDQGEYVCDKKECVAGYYGAEKGVIGTADYAIEQEIDSRIEERKEREMGLEWSRNR